MGAGGTNHAPMLVGRRSGRPERAPGAGAQGEQWVCRAVGRRASRPVRASSPARLMWSGSTLSTGPTGPSPRRYPPNDQADRPGGAGGTRSRPARPPAPGGASASRRSGDSAVARGKLGTAAADPNTAQDAGRVRRVVPRRARQRVRLVLGWRPPPPGSSELTTHARPIRGEATRRGSRHSRRTPRSPRRSRRNSLDFGRARTPSDRT